MKWENLNFIAKAEVSLLFAVRCPCQIDPNKISRAWSLYKYARKIFSKHKAKTGVAILNKPCGALDTDPKFQGTYREESVRVGERLALASLAAEIHTLQLAGIESSFFNKYIGRGQYPRFMWKPVVSKQPSDGKSVCKYATFWASIYGLIDRIIIERVRDRFISELTNLLTQ